MKNLLAALDRLQSEPKLLQRSSLAVPFNPVTQCGPLLTTLESLRKSVSIATVRKPLIDPADAWREFESAKFQMAALDSLQIRSLCTTEKTALHPQFIKALQANPDVLRRTLCLYGLVNAYFSSWRNMPSAEQLESVIQSAIAGQSDSNPVIRVWQQSRDLFSPKAAAFLAQEIVQLQSNLQERLEKSFVGPATNLALHTRAALASQATEYFQRQETVGNAEFSVRYLDWMIREVLPPPLLNDPFEAAVAGLILSKSSENHLPFQEKLRDYVRGDKRLGDPRLSVNRPHWNHMPAQAERRFLSWLARDSITFFFNTILPDTNLNRLRKDFWLLYADQIRDFQVAVSEQDTWKLKSVRDEKLRGFARVDHPTTSAFLMQFEGYGREFVVVEFSETGHAAYIYERKMFEATNVTLRTPQFHVARHLKHKQNLDRIIHNGQWWQGARRRLAELGIWP